MKKFWGDKLGKGIYPQSGDCANFAEALQNVLNQGTVVCAYASKMDYEREEPTHCALKLVNGTLWDGRGLITEEELLQRTKLMERHGQPNEDSEYRPFLKEAEYNKYGELVGYTGINDIGQTKRIEKILRRKYDLRNFI